MPRYFEEFEPGYVLKTATRTITEADIVNFAGIGGNFHQIHLNTEFAQKRNFKDKLAHGLLIITILEGLIERTGIIDRILVFKGIKELNFLNPVYPEDSIHGLLEIVSKDELLGKSAGEIIFAMKGINQTGKTVAVGSFAILVAKRS